MGHWALIKDQDIDGEVEVFDGLSVSLRRREYENSSKSVSIERFTLIGYPNSLKIILNLNKKLDLQTLEAICKQALKFFPVDLDPKGYGYLSLTVENTEEGRERLFKFLGYIHNHVEPINPKEVRQSMEDFLGVKRLLEDKAYQEILNAVRNDDISTAKLLAHKAYEQGYISAHYRLGCVLYLSQKFIEGFEVLNRVTEQPGNQQEHHHANELLAKIVLKIKLPEVEEEEKYVLAFKYANKAGNFENAVNLRENIFMQIEQKLRVANQKVKELESEMQSQKKPNIAPGFNQFKSKAAHEKFNQNNNVYHRSPSAGFLPPIVKPRHPAHT